MKTLVGFFTVFFVLLCFPCTLKAQVKIDVPKTNIFNRSEFTTIQTILNTRNHTNWRLGFFGPIWPEIQSTSGNNFSHTGMSGISLPTSILEWQLKSIGGQNAPFRSGDSWPLPYKSFTSSSQYWYQPGSTTGGYTAGNVAFNFKIPSDKFAVNTFHAGEYAIGVTHNYGSNGFYVIEFTPNSLQVILTIPAAIEWLTSTASKYIEITSLNDFRSTSDRILGSLGALEIGNTVDFNLWAKVSQASIQFTSSKGVSGIRPVSSIRLGSNDNSKIVTSSLSSAWKNYTPNSFKVETGNRNNFTLDLSVSAVDFKTHFYQAGTYTFQLNPDAKSTDNSISSPQNTDVTLEVLPLSEITIPNSGNVVNFEFNTNTSYQQGLSKVIPNQLKISNNETFELYVRSDVAHFKKGGVQTDINSDILQIGVDGSNPVALSPTPQQIISSGIPVLDQELNIKYTIPPTAAQSLVGKEKTTYSINVIYSFTAL